MINGLSKGFFGSSWGLRQGDLLSPFLFTLVDDAFNALMVIAENKGIIKGFESSVEHLSVSHLHFADDTVCFVDVGLEQVTNIKTILVMYECISGLKVNLSKSCMAEIGVGDISLSIHANIIGCKTVNWPLNYLGMPLGGNPRVLSFGIRWWKEFRKNWLGGKNLISL